MEINKKENRKTVELMKQNNDCLVRSKKLADLQVETNQEGKIKIYISKISNES